MIYCPEYSLKVGKSDISEEQWNWKAVSSEQAWGGCHVLDYAIPTVSDFLLSWEGFYKLLHLNEDIKFLLYIDSTDKNVMAARNSTNSHKRDSLSFCRTRVKLQVKLFFSPTPPCLSGSRISELNVAPACLKRARNCTPTHTKGRRYTLEGRRTAVWLWENMNIFMQIVQVLVLFCRKKSS